MPTTLLVAAVLFSSTPSFAQAPPIRLSRQVLQDPHESTPFPHLSPQLSPRISGFPTRRQAIADCDAIVAWYGSVANQALSTLQGSGAAIGPADAMQIPRSIAALPLAPRIERQLRALEPQWTRLETDQARLDALRARERPTPPRPAWQVAIEPGPTTPTRPDPNRAQSDRLAARRVALQQSTQRILRTHVATLNAELSAQMRSFRCPSTATFNDARGRCELSDGRLAPYTRRFEFFATRSPTMIEFVSDAEFFPHPTLEARGYVMHSVRRFYGDYSRFRESIGIPPSPQQFEREQRVEFADQTGAMTVDSLQALFERVARQNYCFPHQILPDDEGVGSPNNNL